MIALSRSGRNLLLLSALLMAAAVVSICAGVLGDFWEVKLGWRGFENANGIRYDYILFTGSEAKLLEVEEAETLKLYYEVRVEAGLLRIKVVKGLDQLIWIREFGESSAGIVEVGLKGGGVYRPVVEGEGARGGFDLRWEVV